MVKLYSLTILEKLNKDELVRNKKNNRAQGKVTKLKLYR